MVTQVIQDITDRIIKRSEKSRTWYLQTIQDQKNKFKANELGPRGRSDGCSNCAHAFAASTGTEKKIMSKRTGATIAIVDSGNDVISSGQPYEGYRKRIREAALKHGAVAQVAGATPGMCDGVTQGFPGMELSLFSRNNIAQATAIALAGNTHDSVLYLGECDKIFPGLMMGAAMHGHLPSASVPSGPMPTGIPNSVKKAARNKFLLDEIGLDELQDTENQSYHAAGVCTFFGTANTNKAVAEAMGLVLPGASFVNPNTDLRHQLTEEVTRKMAQNEIPPLGDVVDERSFVNAIVILMAMGGSTNHTIHIPAMAKYFGIEINWDDLSDISAAVPQIANIYPNNKDADINDFQRAGGMALIMKNLMDAGYLHDDVTTIMGQGLDHYTKVPTIGDKGLEWVEGPKESGDAKIIRKADNPFAKDGGIKLLKGNLGRAVIKTSAVANDNRVVEGLAVVFNDEAGLHEAFKAWKKMKQNAFSMSDQEKAMASKLDQDNSVIIIRGQSANHNGMPELHKAISPLNILQDAGKNTALVTDGRLSGASGTVPAALHTYGEALFKVRDGDKITLDSNKGILRVNIDEEEWAKRPVAKVSDQPQWGVGRQLFYTERLYISNPEEGAIMPLPPIPE